MEDDTDFEVTAEMLIHEAADDEQTLEEEEALQDSHDFQEEVSDLQKESEIPIEELLARYGYGAAVEGEEEEEDEESEYSGSNSSEEDAGETSQTGQTGHQESEPEPDPAPDDDQPGPSHSHGTAPLSNDVELARLRCTEMLPFSDSLLPVQDLLPRNNPLYNHEQVQVPQSSGPASLGGRGRDAGSLHMRVQRPCPNCASLNTIRRITCSSCGCAMRRKRGRPPGGKLANAVENNVDSGSNATSELPPETNQHQGHQEHQEHQEHQGHQEHLRHQEHQGHHGHQPQPRKGRSRPKPEVPERRSMRLMANDERTLEAYFAGIMEEGSDDDEEYFPNEDWKQDIKVGPNYQATVPPRPMSAPYPPGKSQDSLLWSPQGMSEQQVMEYLRDISEQVTGEAVDTRCRDSEQVLHVLQKCSHNVKRALKQIHKQGLSRGMQPWTEDECKQFETGLRLVGKDFFQLSKQVPTRSVKELVEFYYLWKKTERYDVFINLGGKIGRKKITCPPGHITDFMDKYINVYDSDAVELQYGTTTVYAEVKKESS